MTLPSLSNLIGRWMAGLAGILLVLGIWGGFEIRDEAVESPAPRAVRLSTTTPEPGNAIEYVEGYEAGLRRATAENRPLLLIFRAAWCHWCAEFAQGTLIDRRLVGLSRQFVCVMVDADRHAADCRRFGVKEFPTVIVATARDGECRRWTGCPSAAELVSAMSETLPAARMAVADGEDAATTR
jgi:thiol:disulfide interchange protein